jgi:hypothetical protein
MGLLFRWSIGSTIFFFLPTFDRNAISGSDLNRLPPAVATAVSSPRPNVADSAGSNQKKEQSRTTRAVDGRRNTVPHALYTCWDHGGGGDRPGGDNGDDCTPSRTSWSAVAFSGRLQRHIIVLVVVLLLLLLSAELAIIDCSFVRSGRVRGRNVMLVFYSLSLSLFLSVNQLLLDFNM